MHRFDRNVYRSLTMIGQFGINMLAPVLICSFLGMFLDKKFGTSYLVIILFFVGAAAGFWNIYRFSKSIFGKPGGGSAYLHKGRHTFGEGKTDGEAEHESARSEDEQNLI